nr:hypothetical protein GZ17F1_24 [uncultured archaeon GZfos17F1]
MLSYTRSPAMPDISNMTASVVRYASALSRKQPTVTSPPLPSAAWRWMLGSPSFQRMFPIPSISQAPAIECHIGSGGTVSSFGPVTTCIFLTAPISMKNACLISSDLASLTSSASRSSS